MCIFIFLGLIESRAALLTTQGAGRRKGCVVPRPLSWLRPHTVKGTQDLCYFFLQFLVSLLLSQIKELVFRKEASSSTGTLWLWP